MVDFFKNPVNRTLEKVWHDVAREFTGLYEPWDNRFVRIHPFGDSIFGVNLTTSSGLVGILEEQEDDLSSYAQLIGGVAGGFESISFSTVFETRGYDPEWGHLMFLFWRHGADASEVPNFRVEDLRYNAHTFIGLPAFYSSDQSAEYQLPYPLPDGISEDVWVPGGRVSSKQSEWDMFVSVLKSAENLTVLGHSVGGPTELNLNPEGDIIREEVVGVVPLAKDPVAPPPYFTNSTLGNATWEKGPFGSASSDWENCRWTYWDRDHRAVKHIESPARWIAGIHGRLPSDGGVAPHLHVFGSQPSAAEFATCNPNIGPQPVYHDWLRIGKDLALNHDWFEVLENYAPAGLPPTDFDWSEQPTLVEEYRRGQTTGNYKIQFNLSAGFDPQVLGFHGDTWFQSGQDSCRVEFTEYGMMFGCEDDAGGIVFPNPGEILEKGLEKAGEYGSWVLQEVGKYDIHIESAEDGTPKDVIVCYDGDCEPVVWDGESIYYDPIEEHWTFIDCKYDPVTLIDSGQKECAIFRPPGNHWVVMGESSPHLPICGWRGEDFPESVYIWDPNPDQWGEPNGYQEIETTGPWPACSLDLQR